MKFGGNMGPEQENEFGVMKEKRGRRTLKKKWNLKRDESWLSKEEPIHIVLFWYEVTAFGGMSLLSNLYLSMRNLDTTNFAYWWG